MFKAPIRLQTFCHKSSKKYIILFECFFVGVSEDASTSQSCSDEEQQTHRWLQNILQNKAEVNE